MSSIHVGPILVVDDSKEIRVILSTYLKQFGYNVIEANNGLDALKTFEAAPAKYFSLVITDIEMPGMDGLQFAQAMRKLAPKQPVIFMSGGLNPETGKLGRTNYVIGDLWAVSPHFYEKGGQIQPLVTMVRELVPPPLHTT